MNKKGFTLIEVLLVIVIIAILAGIVIIAVNPARQISQANNLQRENNIRAIMDAVYEYTMSNRGDPPSAITDVETEIGSADILVDLCRLLVPDYLTEMPFDPTEGGAHYTDFTDYSTEYSIYESSDGRITVSAPHAELSETISTTR